MSILRFFTPKEELLLDKALKNEPNRLPKEIIYKIKEMVKDVMSSNVLNHEIINRLDSPLQPNEFLRLLCVVFVIMKHDQAQSLLLKLVSNSVQFITKIPKKYKMNQDKELTVCFANHLDWYVSLFTDDCSAIDNNITIEEIASLHSERSCDKTIVSLLSMFCNLTSFDWNDALFYKNKLYFHILSFLLRELTTTFYRLCCYVGVFVQTMTETPSLAPTQTLKILRKFDDCQQCFQRIMSNSNVRQHFPESPKVQIEFSTDVQELFLARYYKFNNKMIPQNEVSIRTSYQKMAVEQLTEQICVVNENFQNYLVNQMAFVQYFTKIFTESSPTTRAVSRSTSTDRTNTEMDTDNPVDRFSTDQIIVPRMGVSEKTTPKANRRISISSLSSTPNYHFNKHTINSLAF